MYIYKKISIPTLISIMLPCIMIADYTAKTISFKPDDAFGGINAQGLYNKKEQKAIIKYGDTIYSFIKIIANPNPTLPDIKNIAPETKLIGTFNNKFNHVNMPVTTYLFGVLTDMQNPKSYKAQESRERLGSNPATYAPIVFHPAEQFYSDGLVGNYFSSTHVATIHDPTGKNKTSFSFESVQEGGIKKPDEFELIGSFDSKPNCSESICSHVIRVVNLYGKKMNNNE